MNKTKTCSKPTYKDICGKESSVWFTINDMEKDGREFLQWAKELGCRWSNGEEIDPTNGTDFHTLAIHADGSLTNVSYVGYMARQSNKHPAPKYPFKDFINSLSEGDTITKNEEN